MSILDKQLLKSVEDKVQTVISGSGLELIEFKIIPQGYFWVIRCIVDYPSGGVTMGECSRLNRQIFSMIEKSNIFENDCSVEVNSPGLNRPLCDKKDYLRMENNTISIWFKQAFRGKLYIEAVICGVNDDAVVVKSQNEQFDIPFNVIRTAKQKIVVKSDKLTR